MRVYENRSRTTVWLVALTLSLILGGWGDVLYATENQDQSLVLAQSAGEGIRKTPVGKLTKKDLRRINDEGPVEITVLYLNPLGQDAGSELSFEVRMSTHSVNLGAYEMENISFLRINGGDEQKALGWSKPAGGGHHRSGVLKFAGPASDEVHSLQVIIRGVEGVQERVFEWRLPL